MNKQQKNTENLKYAQCSNTDARTSDFLFLGIKHFKKLTHFKVTYEHFVSPDTETDIHTLRHTRLVSRSQTLGLRTVIQHSIELCAEVKFQVIEAKDTGKL